MTRALQTVDEVIDALGGTVETSRKAGVSPSQVSGWRVTKRLGAKTFLVLSQELDAQGYTAPPELWGIEQPERAS
jgi:hypothetical protein